MLLALVFGGGGIDAPLHNLVVQLTAFGLLGWQVLQSREGLDRTLAGLMACTVLLPVLQIVPLPPAIWTLFPGRALVAESAGLIGMEDAWRPISVAPRRTLLATIALAPPLAVFLGIASLPQSRGTQACVLALLVTLGIITVVVGGAQLAVANAHFNLYPGAFGFQLYGFFANHNAAGLLLVCALCALVGLLELGWITPPWKWLAGAAGLAIAVAVILTQSRSSALLLAIPALQALFAIRWKNALAPRVVGLVAAGIGLAGILALAIPEMAGRLGQALQHYRTSGFDRPDIWADARVAAERFWPIGSGIGTFESVFQLDESLETLIAPRAGRAHDEYLELAIEAGIFGLALALAWIGWIALAVRRSWGGTSDSRAVGRASGALLASFLIQALVDYPFRAQTLLCVAACAVALLAAPGHHPSRKFGHD